MQAGAYNTYDGVVIAALAEDAAHATTGPPVNAGIPKMTAPGGELVYSYRQGKAALAAGKRIAYMRGEPAFSSTISTASVGPFVVGEGNSVRRLRDHLQHPSQRLEGRDRLKSAASRVG